MGVGTERIFCCSRSAHMLCSLYVMLFICLYNCIAKHSFRDVQE